MHHAHATALAPSPVLHAKALPQTSCGLKALPDPTSRNTALLMYRSCTSLLVLCMGHPLLGILNPRSSRHHVFMLGSYRCTEPGFCAMQRVKPTKNSRTVNSKWYYFARPQPDGPWVYDDSRPGIVRKVSKVLGVDLHAMETELRWVFVSYAFVTSCIFSRTA